jgi:hypothetical protein
VNGQRGQRDGDIGTEKVPISEYFQLQPAFCQDNTFTVGKGTFTLHSKAATILGLVPTATRLVVADAGKWASASDLLASGEFSPRMPVVAGRAPWTSGAPLFVALRRVAGPEASAPAASSIEDLAHAFAESDEHFQALRWQVIVDTPDPYINAATAALCVAADGVWDEPTGTVQHGAVASTVVPLGTRMPARLTCDDERDDPIDGRPPESGWWQTRRPCDDGAASGVPSQESPGCKRCHRPGDGRKMAPRGWPTPMQVPTSV